MNHLNPEVTAFLDQLNHPLRKEIEQLRTLILEVPFSLSETIKWNGPNYSFEEEDRITMKIQPPKQIQLIFHRGAKKLEQPTERLISNPSKLLVWRENDRAIASFKSLEDIEHSQAELSAIVSQWLEARW